MSRTINAILVDDEPGCLSNLQYYLETYCPDIRVVGTAGDFESASGLFAIPGVELAFLDVQLYDRSSFELLGSPDAPEIPIVFVTAYEKYALSALRASALDYLLKPLERLEVLRCYAKIQRHFEAAPAPEPVVSRSTKILLRQGERLYPTMVSQLLFLQANGFYTHVFFLHEGRIREVVVSKPINALHQEWEDPSLMRVHRSYVINLSQVSSLKRTGPVLSVWIGDHEIPVAKRRVSDFLEQYGA